MLAGRKTPLLFITVEETRKVIDPEPIKTVIRSRISARDEDRRNGAEDPAFRVEEIEWRQESVGQKVEEDVRPTAVQSTAWTFLPVDPKTAQPTRSARHDIRAHVAKRQHRQRRQQEAQLHRSKSENVISETDGTLSPSSLLSTRSSSSSSIPTTSTSSDLPAITLPSLLLNPHDPTDQLHLYARQLNTSVPTIWSCYLWQERQHGQLFQAQYSQFKGWGPKYLHPMILTNPAILATTVLFTGCLLRYREGGGAILSSEIVALRSKAYGFVQKAIDGTEDQLSDGTILAVLKLALFEAIFGTVEAYRIHMSGLARMVSLRDGLSGLGMDGYLAHLLMWFDSNLSAVTKSSRYLAGMEGLEEAVADEEAFALGVELADVKLFAEIL